MLAASRARFSSPRLVLITVAALLAWPSSPGAQWESPGAPLPWGKKAASSHAPYAAGRCMDCHDKPGPDPGVPADAGDDQCKSCHDQLKQHAHAFKKCLRCHNAHDSTRRKLLTSDVSDCRNCHKF